jgi:RNA-directed DNA polymerase
VTSSCWGQQSQPSREREPGQPEAVKPPKAWSERSDQPMPAEGEAQPVRVQELWESVFSRENLHRALQRVESNRGAPGADAMPVEELRAWLKLHWREVRRALDEGSYRPAPVRRVSIPKPDGGERELGIPTALDRLIQQAIAQALTPVFDPGFSEWSFGFRPGRSAHQAVRTARGWVAEGYDWVVDIDLERFFDRVQHDVLMARVARKVADKRLLRLIRRYLEAGVMVNGVKQGTEEGTPQGSPLSPLLANVMLDDLDRELERRGHRFVRYADDVRVHVRSERAGERVLAGVSEFLQRRLKLRVNKQKSSVRPATRASVLGFGFFRRSGGEVGIRVSRKARERLQHELRRLTRRRWRIAMPERLALLNRYLNGWCAYFGLAETPSIFEELDKWLRRRLRQVRWVEWKTPQARRRNLGRQGIPWPEAGRWAGSRKGPWRLSGAPPLQRALPKQYWTQLGLTAIGPTCRRLRHAW